MSDSRVQDSQSWPPGSVWLNEKLDGDDELILRPQPTEDPNNPLNWPSWRKYVNFGFACLWDLLITEFLCAATPTWGPMHRELGFSWAILNDSYAAGCGCLGIGAILLTPLSLKFGRRPLYLLSALVTFGVSIWSAKMQTVADLMLVNVLSCLFGALSEVIVQMTIADMFFVHQRGLMNAIFVWVSQIGSSLGGLAAGYITDSQGWRWVWWWNVICFGALFAGLLLLCEETKYVPVLNQSSAEDVTISAVPDKVPTTDSSSIKKKDPEEARYTIHNRPVIDANIPRKSYWQRLSLSARSPGGFRTFGRHMFQPFVLITCFPGILYVALSYGVLVALQNAQSTTLSSRLTEPPYNFSSSGIGLIGLAPFVGVTIGSFIVGEVSDRWIVHLARRNNGIYEPETRLWLIIPFLPLVLAGSLLFGYSIDKGLPWPLVAVGNGLASAGVATVQTVILTYLSDSYYDVIGDALVGVTFVRNSVSTIFVFALDPWFAVNGISNVILAITLIATFCLSFAAVLLKWGKQFRIHTAAQYAEYSLKQARV
ncbi:hypothetical protein UA08_03674 [Talaromyces atroroseus]|uniref:Major facilitator superfamily (MFS) profile domain-containing protein n=1 Tax=Talaromyces atroroseus TaxID=1441469 RepID=A0A225AHT2_TALAT|nr:hypothetical protein UA08_03674 [Talaromyces atroroseus]OKL61002.1 hypothetical protein UA08_03674 [Talaromyces atroroseus]